MESDIQYVLDNGIAEPTFPSWATPCLVVNKSDKSPRFGMDYCEVNACTKPETYLLPRVVLPVHLIYSSFPLVDAAFKLKAIILAVLEWNRAAARKLCVSGAALDTAAAKTNLLTKVDKGFPRTSSR